MVARTVIVSCHEAWGLKGTTASWAGGWADADAASARRVRHHGRWWGTEHTMKKGQIA